jgi:hypothetical protein
MRRQIALVLLLLVLVVFAAFLFRRWWRGQDGDDSSNTLIWEFLTDPTSRAGLITAGGQTCGTAPFILPSTGYIGLLWGDPAAPYTSARRHTGIDIFGDGVAGTIPIYAVYEGWLYRRADWKSTVAIRHEDPLQAGRTIWTYYTHMATRDGTQDFIAADFPRGTSAKFVAQGTFLGYQGEYAGTGTPIALHVHMSIVRSDDNDWFLNELVQANTLDPSPYFGLPLNHAAQPPRPIRCTAQP